MDMQKAAQSEVYCHGNGFFQQNLFEVCTCHPCFTGVQCENIIPSKCGGSIIKRPHHIFSEFHKCICPFNWSGPCCDKKKCAGSNPIPDSKTGKCNCSNPDQRSGEFCEKVKCKNGITAVKDGYCECGMYFTGEFCGKIQCFNGGSSNGSQCHCKSRFSGTNCQVVKCEHGGRQHPSSYRCINCTFLFTGDYCHDINLFNIAMVVIPAVILFAIIGCIVRSRFSKKKYSAAETNELNPPPVGNAYIDGRRNPGAASYDSSAQLRNAGSQNIAMQYREVNADELMISNLHNGFELHFPPDWEQRNASSPHQIGNFPNSTLNCPPSPNFSLNRPPSYDNPPTYDTAVKNLPHMKANV